MAASRALHWLIGVALLGQIGFGFLLDDIAPRDTPARAGVINLHKSFGIVLGLLIVARLAWRLATRRRGWPASMPMLAAARRRARPPRALRLHGADAAVGLHRVELQQVRRPLLRHRAAAVGRPSCRPSTPSSTACTSPPPSSSAR